MKKEEFYLYLTAQIDYLRTKIVLCEERLKQVKEEREYHERTLLMIGKVKATVESLFDKEELAGLQKVVGSKTILAEDKEPSP